ncbi:MAG: hypothetical protein ACI4SF_06555 [Oscillospiraceae bacterium]
MRNKLFAMLSALIITMTLSSCGTQGSTAVKESAASENTTVSSEEITEEETLESEVQTAPVENVVEEGMTPIYGSSLKDGTYDVTVDSSSAMFNITRCTLSVSDGKMSAVMTMSGKGYLYVFIGSGDEAAAADESSFIPFVEDENGDHTFTVPVEALDSGISCAAFSKKKEIWYDRTLLFRADSLPIDSFEDGIIKSVVDLGLADGEYTVEVELSGGSGRASVQSPAKLTVENGDAFVDIVWSSSNYDYMVVNGEKILPISTENGSEFIIPVIGFDFNMPVSADTTAMSTPYEIEYTLKFTSESISAK